MSWSGMTFDANIRYAHLAAKLKIDVLEAGFPSASKTDFSIVEEIARQVGSLDSGPEIAGLCQLREAQVESTIRALEPAITYKKAKMHTYVPVDPQLMVASLGKRSKQKKEIVEDVFSFVEKAIKAGLTVEFSPEGYSRMGDNFEFVSDLIRAAVSAGQV